MSNFNFPNLQRIVALWRRGRERHAKLLPSGSSQPRPAQMIAASPAAKEPTS